MDGFRYPSRRPWLLVVLVVVVGLVVFARTRRKPQSATRDRVDRPASEQRDEPPSLPLTQEPREPIVAGGIAEALESTRRLESAGRFTEVRDTYLAILDADLDRRTLASVRTRLGDLNALLFLDPYPMPEKDQYVVKRGDSLERIARKFGTTIDLLQDGNNLANPNVIKVGDVVRVLNGKFSIEVSKSRRELILKMNDRFFKLYPVGIGKFDKTPQGTFVVTDKEKEPVWWPQGREIPFGHPDNILGTRWMAIRATGDTPPVRGYGIHGTWDDASIGKAESAGCIRMKNVDVEELYKFIPSSTPVTIVE